MNLLASWQLVLFLWATSFRDSLEEAAAPAENPGATGQQLGPLEQSRRCAVSESLEGSGPALYQPSSPRRRVPPAPGEALVRREKGLSAFNWNSFGLRYGRRQAGEPGPRRRAGARDV
ncbi:metastasis-suppressor KiSS-1 [Pipistrellus kuhlii]|uniref:KiSS-1 metastasis suppressor n=1 Tax=Pipistrellus kuhlii TaxID=59472 RepID=A0A7J7UTN1_PIPKU|nr:metastasis-suppressor KiSS-1 [Pipistrellus kuhlii]XP_045438979.1 metastasis-suppressor KiSS-1 [Pipistrellus kuhlii]KAF6316134.1 KiSS-1 metastasis suppressor [Pipistrellus kuhlii]